MDLNEGVFCEFKVLKVVAEWPEVLLELEPDAGTTLETFAAGQHSLQDFKYIQEFSLSSRSYPHSTSFHHIPSHSTTLHEATSRSTWTSHAQICSVNYSKLLIVQKIAETYMSR